MVGIPFDVELINGRGECGYFTIREAGPEDIDAVMDLQQRIMDALPDKDLYQPYEREEQLELLQNECAYIAECGGKVAGFSVMLPPDSPGNYGKYFDYGPDQMAKTASLDLTMVAPEFRGYGLQRDFNKLRIGRALEMGATEFLTTISPDNPHSYRNFLVLDFEIVDHRKLYGGKDRYILRKVIDGEEDHSSRSVGDSSEWAYEHLEEGSVRLLKYIGENVLSGEVRIPDVVDGHPVTALGNRIFCECKQIESVVLPKTLNQLGDAAFAICNRLAEIELPGTVKEIPADCFNECGFRHLTISGQICSIRRGAFVNNRQLEQITLPAGLKEIEMMTFAGCCSLREICIPDGVTKIGEGAFSGCTNLEAVRLPDSLEEIGMMAFLACKSLGRVDIPKNVKKIGEIAFPDTTEVVRLS